MPTRTLTIGGRDWRVFPSGRVTQYDRDEFGIMFVSEIAGRREVRVSRYSPVGTRSRDRSFAEMSDTDLARLFEASQPGDTSPEADYTS
ncbi:MAG TPA: hypothetical protein VKH19_04685 [Gemmatimonadaceae bacterium]|nr:hypothetical protein [Gemmatimonadaceae bacterium]